MSAGAEITTAACRNRPSADVSLGEGGQRGFRLVSPQHLIDECPPSFAKKKREPGGQMQSRSSPMSMPGEKEKVHVVPKCAH
jgi:hypothetical protein